MSRLGRGTEKATPWSAATCRRLVPPVSAPSEIAVSDFKRLGQSADRSAHSKELSLGLVFRGAVATMLPTISNEE
jgi:hypothetical protein